MLTFFQTFVDCKSAVFEVVPECKEGKANEEAQGSAKVRYHRYKIIIVNLKIINKCYIVVTKKCPSDHQVMLCHMVNMWPIYELSECVQMSSTLYPSDDHQGTMWPKEAVSECPLIIAVARVSMLLLRTGVI